MDDGKIEEGLKMALLEEDYNIFAGVFPDDKHISIDRAGS